jgi:hypothetical protein
MEEKEAEWNEEQRDGTLCFIETFCDNWPADNELSSVP